jgi:phosphopantetheine adenylyltransferase
MEKLTVEKRLEELERNIANLNFMMKRIVKLMDTIGKIMFPWHVA